MFLLNMKCTRTGRVVYDRKLHPFSLKDLSRITEGINNRLTTKELRESPGVVRYIKILGENMYKQVADLFYPRLETKALTNEKFIAYKEFMTEFVEVVTNIVFAQISRETGAAAEDAGFFERLYEDFGDYLVDMVGSIAWGNDYNKFLTDTGRK